MRRAIKLNLTRHTNVKKKMDFYQIISNKAAQEQPSGAAFLLAETERI